MPPGWPSPSSAFGLLFCKMRSMCWDVCNLLHAVFPPWGHTPSQAATHCDTCWQAALRARSAPGDGPVTHTRPPLRSHPHPGRSHCSRRAPPAGPRRRFCAPSPSPRRETAAGRAAMSSRRRPPARPPGPNSLQMPGGPAAPVRAGRRLSGAPCRAPRAGSRSWRPRRDWGRGLPTPEGEGLVPLGPAPRSRPRPDSSGGVLAKALPPHPAWFPGPSPRPLPGRLNSLCCGAVTTLQAAPSPDLAISPFASPTPGFPGRPGTGAQASRLRGPGQALPTLVSLETNTLVSTGKAAGA